MGTCVMSGGGRLLICGRSLPIRAASRSDVATPAMMPPVIINTSKNLADAVIGAPVIASCTEPTSESPDNSTVTPAPMITDGDMSILS